MSVRILPLLMLSALLFAACEERNTGGQRHAPVPPDSGDHTVFRDGNPRLKSRILC